VENRFYCPKCKEYCDEIIQVSKETTTLKRVFKGESYVAVDSWTEENRSDTKCAKCKSIIAYS
jgi:phage FluMu protein Com